jgi:predicted unusual protein kinase regulating ubiquinone biosynthesis (AarF/ABC1/UbiB family)
MLSEGARRLARGESWSFGDLLLTPSNMEKLANRLSEMRGAAMKVGQLISMDSGHLLPPQLGEVLAGLREDAHPMPLGQVAEVLNLAWGTDWDQQFERFIFTPLAAASIGQVHAAKLRDGHSLAIKIQYPGIRQSIDSDVDNVATMLRLFKLLPNELEFDPLLNEAKKQLHAEADYLREADAMRQYAHLIGDDTRFVTPELIEPLTTREVLSMTQLEGESIDTLSDQPKRQRAAAAQAMLELALREVFEWGLVQTDPNFANYLYQQASGKIGLLDFGAVRAYSAERRQQLISLLNASLAGGESDIAKSAVEIGYLGEDDPESYRQFVIQLLLTATEPVRKCETYQFANSDLAQRMSDQVIELRLKTRYGRLPPPDVLFLHRKLGGLYLLLTRLKIDLDVKRLIQPYV